MSLGQPPEMFLKISETLPKNDLLDVAVLSTTRIFASFSKEFLDNGTVPCVFSEAFPKRQALATPHEPPALDRRSSQGN
jgi:hypothetical protein